MSREHAKRFEHMKAEPVSRTEILYRAPDETPLIKATVVKKRPPNYRLLQAAYKVGVGPAPDEEFIYLIMVDSFSNSQYADDEGYIQEFWTKERLQHMLSMLETTEGILK